MLIISEPHVKGHSNYLEISNGALIKSAMQFHLSFNPMSRAIKLKKFLIYGRLHTSSHTLLIAQLFDFTG